MPTISSFNRVVLQAAVATGVYWGADLYEEPAYPRYISSTSARRARSSSAIVAMPGHLWWPLPRCNDTIGRGSA
jgi:hypothetical protein